MADDNQKTQGIPQAGGLRIPSSSSSSLPPTPIQPSTSVTPPMQTGSISPSTGVPQKTPTNLAPPTNLPTGTGFNKTVAVPPPLSPPIVKDVTTSPTAPIQSRSTIRTMSDDLGLPKKNSSTSIPPSFMQPQTMQNNSTSQSSPPSIARSPITPPLGLQTNNIPSSAPESSPLSVPYNGGGSKKAIIIISVILLVLLLLLIWFFVIKDSDGDDNLSPTPTSSGKATSTPVDPITSAFNPIDSLVLSTDGSPIEKINKAIEAKNIDSGASRLYHITDQSDSSNTPYSFTKFSSTLGLAATNEINTSIDDNTLYFSLFKDSQGKNSKGFIVRITNPGLVDIGMRQWESTLSSDLQGLFGFDVSKSASSTFLDATYKGNGIRYRNFGDPFSTIDYTILKTPTDVSFLIVTNTRDHIFALIDVLSGFSSNELGK